MNANPAYAGRWVEVTQTDDVTTQPGGGVTQAQLNARLEGSTFVRQRGGTLDDGGYNISTPPGWGDWNITAGSGSNSDGRYIRVRKSFLIRKLYRWVPNIIYSSPPYGPDPEDKPEPVLRVKGRVSSEALAYSDTEKLRFVPWHDEVVVASAQGVAATPRPHQMLDPQGNVRAVGKRAVAPYQWRLYQKVTNGEYLVYSPAVSLVANAEVPGNRTAPDNAYPSIEHKLSGMVQSGGDWDIELDERGLTITNPWIETSFWKDSLQRTAHRRNRDGSITTDSAAVLSGGLNGPNTLWIADTTFNANPVGYANSMFSNTNPRCTWQLSNCGAPSPLAHVVDDDGNWVDLSAQGKTLYLQSVLGTGFNGFPKTGTVTVDAVDTQDGAVARNSFTVNWHLPFEKTEDLPSEPKVWKMSQLIPPWYDGARSAPIDPAQSFDIAAGLEGAAGAAGAAVGGPSGAAAALAIAQGLAGLFDVQWQYAGSDIEAEFRNDPTQWDLVRPHPEQGLPGRPENVDYPEYLEEEEGWRRFNISVWKTMRWTKRRWKADHYDANGFHSSGHNLFRDVAHKIEFEPYYTLRTTSGSGSSANPQPTS